MRVLQSFQSFIFIPLFFFPTPFDQFGGEATRNLAETLSLDSDG